jgi:hypothetical protein
MSVVKKTDDNDKDIFAKQQRTAGKAVAIWQVEIYC